MPMSKGSLRKREPTDHHTIPSTVGGSDDPINLITGVERRTHNEYHSWAGNMPPCFGFRRILLNAVGGEFCPEPEVLENVLQITTMPDWQRLYDARASVPVSAIGGRQKAEKSAEFQVTFWKEEEVLIRHIMHALLNGRKFPGEEQNGENFRDNLLLATRQSNVRDAMLRVLTQKHTKNRYMWTNPMHDVTRDALVHWTKEMPRKTKVLEPKVGRVRDDFERILSRQLESLNAYVALREDEKRRWKGYAIPSGS